MDESGRHMSPSQLSQFFEDESFNLYTPNNHGDGGLNAWLFPQDIPPTSSSVEHTQNRPRGRPPGSTVVVTATVFKKPKIYTVGSNQNGEGGAGAVLGGGASANAGEGDYIPIACGGGHES
ncbi:hypothetical protein RIF29_18293 [Crotalaria pallida]|uniref:Uncharacterized protein n=1 Tax=Crotalaria pallida TaxID=3830 RepID=A0AAN9FIN9_CROPI